jgi:flagellar biosynthetic protein FlhB
VAEEPDKESKTEDPTAKRLDDARKKGDVVKTMDLPQWASLAGVFGVLALLGGWLIQGLAEKLLPFIARPHAMEVTGEAMGGLMRTLLLAAAPIFCGVLLTAAGAAIAASIGQTGLMFTPSKLKPDLKHLSPMQGIKRLFGADALFHFGKSVVKLVVITVVVWMVFKPHARELETLVALHPAALLPLARDLLIAMFTGVLIFLLAGAGADWLWQRHRWATRMKMSKEELKEDYKSTEGDPHIKAKLKQLRMERSKRRMMQAVPTATVVV